MMKITLRKHKNAIFVTKKYNDEDKRARDHCHLTGKYRGSAHEACNLNFELTQCQSYFIIYEVATVTLLCNSWLNS